MIRAFLRRLGIERTRPALVELFDVLVEARRDRDRPRYVDGTEGDPPAAGVELHPDGSYTVTWYARRVDVERDARLDAL